MTVRFSVILFLMMTFIKGEATGSKIKFSLSSKLSFLALLSLLSHDGVDSCVFLIFMTRVDPNKRNKHRLRSIYNWCTLKKESLRLRFPGEPQKHIGNSALSPGKVPKCNLPPNQIVPKCLRLNSTQYGSEGFLLHSL